MIKILLLTKEDFYIHIEKEFPIAMKKFHSYIDDFKASSNWDHLFNGIEPHRGNDYHEVLSPKFHQIPFAMQKGIIENFFVLENIQYYSFPHPQNEKAYGFHLIDVVHESLFKSGSYQYPNHEDAEIGAITMAFKVLNDSFVKNLN